MQKRLDKIYYLYSSLAYMTLSCDNFIKSYKTHEALSRSFSLINGHYIYLLPNSFYSKILLTKEIMESIRRHYKK